MFCNHCGAAAVGRYCSCCGRRLVNNVDAFNRTIGRERKDFCNKAYLLAGKSLHHMHLASSCWYACEIKYGKGLVSVINGESVLALDAYERLELVKTHATALYERLKAESF